MQHMAIYGIVIHTQTYVKYANYIALKLIELTVFQFVNPTFRKTYCTMKIQRSITLFYNAWVEILKGIYAIIKVYDTCN